MEDSGLFNIEIDADEELVHITSDTGKEYLYTVEELAGKGILDRLKSGGAREVIYSQGEMYTREEFIRMKREQEEEDVF